MSEEIYSRQVMWRGLLFDSVLESSWAASLTVWGVDWHFHPGNIQLSNGEVWQPDFWLKNAAPWGEDIILECKGGHNERLYKAQLAQEDNPDKLILIGRDGWLRGDDLGSYPGAVWHRPDGSDYIWDINGKGYGYVSAEQASEKRAGLRFFRAVEGSRRIV